MYSGPTPHEQEERARVVDQAWLDKHMPALGEGWKEEDDMRADGEPIQTWSGRGLMYKGRWLISPERQERSVRLFWVSYRSSRCLGLGVRSLFCCLIVFSPLEFFSTLEELDVAFSIIRQPCSSRADMLSARDSVA